MEKISLGNGVVNKVPAFKEEVKQTNVQAQRSTSGNSPATLIIGLAALASVGIAGVALHKNSSLTSELKSVTKKLADTEELLKKSIEDKEKEIKEGIEKAIKELEEKGKKDTTPQVKTIYRTQYIPAPEPKVKKSFTDKGTEEGLKYLEEQAALARKEKKEFDRKLIEAEQKKILERRMEIIDTLEKESEYIDAVERNIAENKKADLARQAELKQMRDDAEAAFKDYEYNPAMKYTGKSAEDGVKYLEEQESYARKEKKEFDRKLIEAEQKKVLERRKEILETVEEEKDYFDAVERNIAENKKADLVRQAELEQMKEDAEVFGEQNFALFRSRAKANVKHWYNKVKSAFTQNSKAEVPLQPVMSKKVRKNNWQTDAKGTYEGLKYLEAEEKAVEQAKHASDTRNNQWVKEQEKAEHEKIQAEYEALGKKYRKKLDKLEQVADYKVQNRRLQEMQQNYITPEPKKARFAWIKGLFGIKDAA